MTGQNLLIVTGMIFLIKKDVLIWSVINIKTERTNFQSYWTNAQTRPEIMKIMENGLSDLMKVFWRLILSSLILLKINQMVIGVFN